MVDLVLRKGAFAVGVAPKALGARLGPISSKPVPGDACMSIDGRGPLTAVHSKESASKHLTRQIWHATAGAPTVVVLGCPAKPVLTPVTHLKA